MKFFQIILRLIHEFNLVPSADYNQLTVDVQKWESECTPESKDKSKQLYAKAHSGVFLKLINPFVYFFLLKWVMDLKNGGREEGLMQ